MGGLYDAATLHVLMPHESLSHDDAAYKNQRGHLYDSSALHVLTPDELLSQNYAAYKVHRGR